MCESQTAWAGTYTRPKQKPFPSLPSYHTRNASLLGRGALSFHRIQAQNVHWGSHDVRDSRKSSVLLRWAWMQPCEYATLLEGGEGGITQMCPGLGRRMKSRKLETNVRARVLERRLCEQFSAAWGVHMYSQTFRMTTTGLWGIVTQKRRGVITR